MIEQTSTTKGKLYIVATPIGNLEDLSLRAQKTLEKVDFILAEDTRHTQKLLNQLGLKKKLWSYHCHNENDTSRLQTILNALKEGREIALVSDAGTPLISDPGYPLVHQARQMGVKIIPIPGPCAIITALCAAGLPSDHFTFGGFLPEKSSKRIETLKQFQVYPHTLIFYEAPHRILSCLEDIASVFGDQTTLVLAKELTKIFESFQWGTPQSITAWLKDDVERLKGEFVLLIGPRPKESDNTHVFLDTLNILLATLPLKQAVQLTAEITKMPKNLIYEHALSLKK